MSPGTSAPPRPPRTIAITGACTYLGTELIKSLEVDERYDAILALDIRRPETPFDKTTWHAVDLTSPTIGGQIADILKAHDVDTVVHGAFLSQPTHATEWAHELEDIGTMHLLTACAEAQPRRLILRSTTMVYGASRDNPNHLTEDAPLKGHTDSRFINDKVSAENQIAAFARENPGTQVCVLRFAPILGPRASNMFTRFFARPIAPVLMGHDPLLQFLHEADALAALRRAVHTDCKGAFNIVGDGVLPYTTVLASMGRIPLPMPHFVARPLSKALWMTQVFDSPPSFLDFLRYLCVADASKARSVLGIEPGYNINRIIRDFLGVAREDGSPDFVRAYG